MQFNSMDGIQRSDSKFYRRFGWSILTVKDTPGFKRDQPPITTPPVK
jgi:hypothetical protein